jgi:predicted Zn-dependent protease
MNWPTFDLATCGLTGGILLFDLPPSNSDPGKGFSLGWWVMATQLSLHQQLREANLWFRWLRMLVTRTPAIFLVGSLFVASVRAQDVSEPTTGQRSGVHPAASSEGTQKAPAKSRKNLSKYDVDRIGQRGVGAGTNEYSLEEERELGRELSEQVEMTTKLITDPVITEYVDRLGQTIVRNSDAQVPFTIKVVDSDEVNAFALPGGYLYVHGGLIIATENEAELAGLMAHEIAHVAARHATRAETRMKAFTVLSIALAFFGGPVAGALQAAVGVAGPATFMKFGRDAEREADLLGLEYEYVAGYDPQALVQFFEKLHPKEKQKHNLIARAFATHPMTEDRIRRAQEEISTLLPAKTEYIVDTSAFQEVKSRLADLMHEHAPLENGRPVLHRRTRENDKPADDKGPALRTPSLVE